MFDIHTHILPAIDDGPAAASESMRMLQDAYKQGVRLCAATPHIVLHRDEAIPLFLQKRRESAEMLFRLAEKSNMHLPEILYGAELYLDHNVINRPGLDRLCIGDSPCILVEFPTEKYDPYWGEWLHSMALRGFHPIVAHVDRYLEIDKMLSDFTGISITYQINASRMLSFAGRRFITRLLEEGRPCIIASDMHNMSSRACNMKEAYLKAQKKFPEYTESLFKLRAGKILGK